MKKQQKEISLVEFRAWLEGIEELVPRGWVPDASQWKLIRNKIDCITETKEKEVIYQQAPDRQQVQQPVYQQAPQQPVYQQVPPQSRQSTLPILGDEDVSMTPEAAALLSTGVIPTDGTLSKNAANGRSIQTPHLDTSKIPYDSDFS